MPVKSVTAIIIYKKKILLLLRDNRSGVVNPNRWGLIGGGIDFNETPKEAMEREAKEEINITPQNLIFFGKTPWGKYRFFSKLTDQERKKIKIGNEGQALKFYTLEQIKILKLTPKLSYWVKNYFNELMYLISTEDIDVRKLKNLIK